MAATLPAGATGIRVEPCGGQLVELTAGDEQPDADPDQGGEDDNSDDQQGKHVLYGAH